MITLYTWGTPNGRKISIALEEMGLPYKCVGIDINKDDQFAPDFLQISPNNKIPALVDDGRPNGQIALFESGAILMYLAQKTGQFIPPQGTPEYWTMMQWLMWQMGGFGPMLGQTHHFVTFNPEVSDYAAERFQKEAKRLYGVLDKHLENQRFIAGDISIAEFAIWPWASRFEWQKIDLNEYPNVMRWYKELAKRDGFIAGYNKPSDLGPIPMP